MAKHVFIQEIVTNRRAFYDYEILDKFEAGIKLSGNEVKAVKNGWVNLTGSYVVIRNNEAFIINLNISPYQPNNLSSKIEPLRTRKLLLQKREILNLNQKTKKEKLTLIPLKVYNKNGLIKLEIALVKNKKKYNKKEIIKKREEERRIKQVY
ncbi:MAG: SsrA-binding protein SmpB [Minisyncoccia bacterium]|jgi:SsrA-binding protein